MVRRGDGRGGRVKGNRNICAETEIIIKKKQCQLKRKNTLKPMMVHYILLLMDYICKQSETKKGTLTEKCCLTN